MRDELPFFSRVANVTIVPNQDQNQRTTQMIVKKINSNGRIVVVNSPNLTASQQIATINKIAPSTMTTTTAQRGGPRWGSKQCWLMNTTNNQIVCS